MQIDEYRVLTEAVSFGIAKAWRKTLGKHAFQGNSVMLEITEYFSFPDKDGEVRA